MTLQIINSTTAGATQDLSTRVFMASERLGLPPFTITQNAEEGAVAHSTLVVDDPSGNLTLKGHRRVYFVETTAPTGQQVIGNCYVGVKEISRGDWRVGPLARTFSVSLQDANTLISRRLVVGADGNRLAETDVARVQWLLTTTEANEFNASNTYVSTDDPVNMDAVDYRGQSVTAILSDCSQASGKNWWVIYEESLGEFSLWYDFDYSEAYASTLQLSNDPDDIDDSTTFAYFPTAVVSEDPSRVYSGTLVSFDPANTETTRWIYEQAIATGNEFVFRDVAYPSLNVKTETKARARATRYNADSDEEDHVIKLSFVVPSASVNGLMHGMRIAVKGTHWGLDGLDLMTLTDLTWARALNRTVTQIGPSHYQIDAELSPIPQQVCPSPLATGRYPANNSGTSAGTGHVAYQKPGIADPGFAANPGFAGDLNFPLYNQDRPGDLPDLAGYDLWGDCSANTMYCIGIVGDGTIAIQTIYSSGGQARLTAYLEHYDPSIPAGSAAGVVTDETQENIVPGSVVTFDVSSHNGTFCTHRVRITDPVNLGSCGNGWGFAYFDWTRVPSLVSP